MSWDAPPPGEPPQQPTQPYGQPAQPYGQPTPPPQQQPTTPYPYGYGPYGDPAQPQQQQTAAYGQQPQPAPQWDQYGGYGGPYYPAYQPPPKRNRTGFYVALGAVGVVVAAGVAAAVIATSSKSGSGTPSADGSSTSTTTSTSQSTSPSTAASSSASSGTSQTSHTVVVPQSAGPLTLLSDSDTAQRISTIESSLTGNAAYSNPQIGFYTVGSDSSYSVWMLAEDTSNVSAIQTSVATLGTMGMARSIAQGAHMTDVTAQDAGALGGALLCGKIPVSGNEYRVCEWVDESSFGWVYFMPSVPQADVLTYTLDIRNAAEQ